MVVPLCFLLSENLLKSKNRYTVYFAMHLKQQKNKW